ncbi:Putative chloramphenicol acetyltransferase-like domain superfamily [Colletotrichum destructivum]|uniref:Chloramphenicol acetyltransferase-like domain superfamily n=1 Tax=Colletotrichum destructivum TaxID=34406 RepID=A0AAX4I1B1_9PEZI|nr:Putative chloramphenicol acetyltransferase-like domain superfamily [Colletotrichum destructivum]
MTAWARRDDDSDIYIRSCGPMEHAYVTMVHTTRRNGREDFIISYILQFREDTDPSGSRLPLKQRLCEAWKALRFEHPMIAVELGHDRQSLLYVSTVDQESSMEEWLAETFIVDAGEQRPAGAVFAELRPPRLMELRFLPNTGELLLRSSHWRIDGAGCSLLMDRFFDIMASERTASPTWGEEISRLPPALEDALQLPSEASPRHQKWGQEWISDFGAASPSVGLPCRPNPGRNPGNPGRELLILSEEDTATLVSACKTIGITVTAALHAAVILQTRKMAPAEIRSNNFMDVLMCDLRSYLPEPYITSAYAVMICSMPQLGVFASLAEREFLGTARMVMESSRSYDMHTMLQSLRPASVAFKQMLDMGAASTEVSERIRDSSFYVEKIPGL